MVKLLFVVMAIPLNCSVSESSESPLKSARLLQPFYAHADRAAVDSARGDLFSLIYAVAPQ
jgi:hypothetical protein